MIEESALTLKTPMHNHTIEIWSSTLIKHQFHSNPITMRWMPSHRSPILITTTLLMTDLPYWIAPRSILSWTKSYALLASSRAHLLSEKVKSKAWCKVPQEKSMNPSSSQVWPPTETYTLMRAPSKPQDNVTLTFHRAQTILQFNLQTISRKNIKSTSQMSKNQRYKMTQFRS